MVATGSGVTETETGAFTLFFHFNFKI